MKSCFCRPGQFKCLNGNCIDEASVCDDVDQCGDQTDEIGCRKYIIIWQKEIVFSMNRVV